MRTPDCFPIIGSDPRLISKLADRSVQEGISILYEADVEAGVINYDTNKIDYYLFPSASGHLYFSVQWNQVRGERPKNPANQADCPVDLQTIIEKNRQHWFTFKLHGRLMAALGNPFGYMPTGMTIVSAEHEPQAWRHADAAETNHRIRRTARDLYALAAALPSFVVIYNGAGASLPNHNHYQLFELPPGHGPLAIQQAAAKRLNAGRSTVVSVGLENDYPVVAFRICGNKELVVDSAVSLIESWEDVQGEAASANLIALTESGELCVYFVPRNSLFRKGAGFAGAIASLELCGSFICSTDWELEEMKRGRFSYNRLWRVLEAVRPRYAHMLSETSLNGGLHEHSRVSFIE